MSEIVPLAPRHSLAVAALHMSYLPTPFRGAPGRHLLASYYNAITLGRGATGYVAERQGRILGFICGVWAVADLRSTLLKTQWPAMALWVPANVLMRPQFVILLVRRLGNPVAEPVDRPAQEYELRPIVVDPAVRGTGLAASLLDQLLLDARSRGFQRMHLYTEADNVAAQAFYHKTGFAITGTFQRHGRFYLRYERSLADTR